MAEPIYPDHNGPGQSSSGHSRPFKEPGRGLGLLDSESMIRQWERQDGIRRSPSFESPNPKRARVRREGRNASFGMKPGPQGSGNFGAVDLDVDDDDDDRIKVDKVFTDKRFNVWNLPSKAKVLLLSNLPLNIANPRFVSSLCANGGC